VVIEMTFADARGRAHPASVRLRYRRVNQAEPYRMAEMEPWGGDGFQATIPGDYTNSPYPLQYHFELFRADGRAWLYPGFHADLANQPYFVVRQVRTGNK
jgi:hypothetical protein